MRHTELALRRPVTTVVVFVALALVGLIASRLLPLEKFPDIEFPGIFVQIPYEGSSPEEIERLITRPVEEALATLSGVAQRGYTQWSIVYELDRLRLHFRTSRNEAIRSLALADLDFEAAQTYGDDGDRVGGEHLGLQPLGIEQESLEDTFRELTATDVPMPDEETDR